MVGMPGPVVETVNVIHVREVSGSPHAIAYLEVRTDTGLSGYGGPLYPEQEQEAERLVGRLRTTLAGCDLGDCSFGFSRLWNTLFPTHPLTSFAAGADPLTGDPIWDTRRNARHTATGNVVTALSAVDNALWNLRGKTTGQPVSQLLGGSRAILPAYLSIMPGNDIPTAIRKAEELFAHGNTAQKWFLEWGPPDGAGGLGKTRQLAEGLRSTLGPDATLMFDFAVKCRGRCDWDVDYATQVAAILEGVHPKWLEEPFSPEEIDCYRRLRDATDVPLATGEHTYSRWHIKPFLEEGLIRYVQCDPEWCGGVSELLAICDLARTYDGVQVVPHGHHVLAAAHVVASQPSSLCPMVEHGPGWLGERQRAQLHSFSVVGGRIDVPACSGLGPDIDWDRFERV